MKPVALATCSAHPCLTGADRSLIPAFARHGLFAEPARWDGAVEWRDYSAVLVRSAWDYHLRLDEFLAWVAALEAAAVPLLNEPGLVRWNADKGYLRALEACGVAVPPTYWVEQGAAERPLADVLREAGWEQAVVKPMVSAAAYETWRTSPGEAEAHERRFRRLCEQGGVMVQRFVPEVMGDGEWSLVFFGRAFSHAVRKQPRQGDFRVQAGHGGTHVPDEPPREVLRAAAAALRALPGDPLYTRVDGFATRAGFLLMEIELIEPDLFLLAHPLAAARLARAAVRRLALGRENSGTYLRRAGA